METLDEKIEEAYESWRSTWELDGMTIRDIYEAGYRHAIEDIEDETPNVEGNRLAATGNREGKEG